MGPEKTQGTRRNSPKLLRGGHGVLCRLKRNLYYSQPSMILAVLRQLPVGKVGAPAHKGWVSRSAFDNLSCFYKAWSQHPPGKRV